MPVIPASPRRLVLVNPTRYLGNLLLAGGLMQDFAALCERQGRELKIVVDAGYRELLTGTLPDTAFIWYPRRDIAKATSAWQKLRLYWGCIGQIRAFAADIAFNIEEDSVSHRLTQLSGARFKLGCSTTRHGWGYDHVVPIDFSKRPDARMHRWYSFLEVFQALGLPEPAPHYLRFPEAPVAPDFLDKLRRLGLDPARRFVALHAGATKDYKLWPLPHFARLTQLLVEQGCQLAFIGAGKDADNTAAILAQLPASVDRSAIVDCTNKLSLAELVPFFRVARFIIGNDSGPFHLASAVGVPGVVIFGPTDARLWAPLGAKSVVMKSGEVCSPDCTRRYCLHEHRCLWAITPESIVSQMQRLLG